MVFQAFESRILDWPSFYFTANDYCYRFTLESKKRFVELLKVQFNRGVTYRGQRMKWDSVIQQKVLELSKAWMPDLLACGNRRGGGSDGDKNSVF